MSNKKSMYAIERNDEYLAHYGIKGMKWGVRKALASGSDRALARQYRKASRKLEKLQKRAESGKKYARRAAVLGAGAAAAGGLAAAGTSGVAKAMRGVSNAGSKVALGAGQAASKLGGAMNKAGIRGGGRVKQAGDFLQSKGLKGATKVGMAANAVDTWGKATTGGKALEKIASNAYSQRRGAGRRLTNAVNKQLKAGGHGALSEQISKLGNVTNNTLARIGAGAAGVGLAAGAGYNAYRAATTKKAAQKAANFKREMNQAFKGTKYANGENGSNSSGKRKRRRNG